MKASDILSKPKISLTNSLTAEFRKGERNFAANFHEAEYWMRKGYELAVRRLKKKKL